MEPQMKNVKLVATDMDGTLLMDAVRLPDGKMKPKQMPDGVIDLVKRLIAKDILFVVSSGRLYRNLIRFFEEVIDDIVIIAENGALVIDKGQIIYENAMDKEAVAEVVAELRKIKGARITMCGINNEYIFKQDVNEVLEDMAANYFVNCKFIESLDEIESDERIIKFGIFDDGNDAVTTFGAGLAHLQGKYQIAVSGAEWADILNHGVHKGIAVKAIQEKYGISYEETMTFGDQLNDIEMMECAYFSYAVENAVDQVKAVSHFTAPSNNDHGVLTIIKKLLEIIE